MSEARAVLMALQWVSGNEVTAFGESDQSNGETGEPIHGKKGLIPTQPRSKSPNAG